MKKRMILIIIVISTMAYFSIGICWAEDGRRSLRAVELLSGFGQAELAERGDYRLIPFIVALDFDMKPLTKRIGFNPKSLVQFQVEPFLALATSPETNMEGGVSFLLKFGFFPETSKLQPYIKFGSGMIYMSQHTLEQPTQFNFISHVGAGFHLFLNHNYALTLEYRLRHLSNAGINNPNRGIDSDHYFFGITQRF